jgi:hypothetical protein
MPRRTLRIKGHLNPSLKAIDDFRNKLAGVAKAYDKAFYDASNVDSAIRHADAAMRAYDRNKNSKSTSKSLAKWMKDGKPDRSGQVRSF